MSPSPTAPTLCSHEGQGCAARSGDAKQEGAHSRIKIREIQNVILYAAVRLATSKDEPTAVEVQRFA